MDKRVDYDRRQYAVYSAGRAPLPAIVELWTEAFARYIPAGQTILDLGCGIGTWSELLADRFDATVIGVEPSARMREIAEREHAHPRITYLAGAAERIPLGDASCDLALLSYVIHHVEDREACAAELFRVIRPGGRVLVRGTMRELVPRVPWLAFFPSGQVVAARQMPAAAEVAGSLERAGFDPVAHETLEQETAPSLRAQHERLKLRAISTLELISDEEFEEGLERLRIAAERETEPTPVIEPVDLLVFRR